VRKDHHSLTRKLKQNNLLKRLALLPVLILAISTFSLGGNLLKARQNSYQPLNAYLVLGGSIMREIYIAQLVKFNPRLPVIISQGSDAPCTFLIFQKEKSQMDNVWLENCANSTFTNFVFSTPILKQWGIKKVGVITSKTHLPRASLLAKILLNSQGIAVDVIAIEEQRGISGNTENKIKTILDVTRSLGWAFVAQFVSLPCFNVTKLTEVDLSYWYRKGFNCEHRGNLVRVRQGRLEDR
jgi:hypothetical protein